MRSGLISKRDKPTVSESAVLNQVLRVWVVVDESPPHQILLHHPRYTFSSEGNQGVVWGYIEYLHLGIPEELPRSHETAHARGLVLDNILQGEVLYFVRRA